MTTLERMARAMARQWNSYHFDRGDSDTGWEELVDEARAAVSILRDLTPHMAAAAGEAFTTTIIDVPGVVTTFNEDGYPTYDFKACDPSQSRLEEAIGVAYVAVLDAVLSEDAL